MPSLTATTAGPKSWHVPASAAIRHLMVVILLLALYAALSGCSRSSSSGPARAKELIGQGKPAQAVKILSKWLEAKPDDVQAMILLGHAREYMGNFDEARAAYSRALEQDPQYGEAWEARGRLLGCLQKPEAALKDLERAAQLQPHPASIMGIMGLIYFHEGKLAEAYSSFEKVNEYDAKEESGYFGRAAVHIERKEYGAAIEEMNKLLTMQPENADAFLRRGFAYLADAQPRKAIEDFNKALELAPSMKSVYWYRAVAYRKLNALEKALKDYQRAALARPTDSILYLNQGVIFMMMGKYAEALEMLSRSIVLDPQNPLPYTNRARLHLRTGNYLASLHDLNKALEISQDHPWLLVKRAYIFKMMGRGDRALKDLDKAVKLAPDNPEAWLLRGSLFYNAKQLERAISDLHRGISLNPEDPLGYQLLAEALLKKGATAEAMKQVALALKKESTFAPAYVTMGDIHLADSHIERAVEAYSRALNIYQYHFGARLRRAKLFMELNEEERAIMDIDQAA
ncbi:MAG: tetratricopeptide repeat protein, partial [Deltaproteobacteria bacterium]